MLKGFSADAAGKIWTDPSAAAALLPPGMTADEKSNGRAFFWFLDWQYCVSPYSADGTISRVLALWSGLSQDAQTRADANRHTEERLGGPNPWISSRWDWLECLSGLLRGY
jgi:hypothetical protein